MERFVEWMRRPTNIQAVSVIAGAAAYYFTKDTTVAVFVGGTVLAVIRDNSGDGVDKLKTVLTAIDEIKSGKIPTDRKP